MQHFVVLQVMQQRVRHAILRGREKDGRARHPRRRRRLDALNEQVEGHRVLGEPLHQHDTAALPRRQQREHDGADQDRGPAAVGNLERIRRKERQVDEHQRRRDRDRRPRRPIPQLPHDDKDQDRVDQHCERHGDTVGARQVVRAMETDDERDHRGEQRPVDERDVDLPDRALGRMLDREPRTITHLNGRSGERKRA